MIGWSGRRAEDVEAHIAELGALGVPRPTQTPAFYRVASSLLTTGDAIEVVGPHTSGEVEFFLAQHDDGLWVGLGSDQTDRAVERTSVALSKQLCAKVAAPVLWRFDDVAPHWDQLVLRAWAHRNGARELYQQSALDALIAPQRLLSMYETMRAGMVLFGGTIPAVNGVGPADAFEMELEDAVLGRTLRHRYRIITLPHVL